MNRVLETPGAWLLDWGTGVIGMGTVVRTTHSDRLSQIIRAPQVGPLPEARSMGRDFAQHFHVVQGRLTVYLFTMFERAKAMPSDVAAQVAQRHRMEWPDAVDWLTEYVTLDGEKPQLLAVPPWCFYWVEVLTPALFLSTDDFAAGYTGEARPSLPATVVREYL